MIIPPFKINVVTNWSQSITFIRIYLLTCNFELTVALATVLANHTSEFRVESLVRPIIVAICDVSMYYVNVTEFQPITRAFGRQLGARWAGTGKREAVKMAMI